MKQLHGQQIDSLLNWYNKMGAMESGDSSMRVIVFPFQGKEIVSSLQKKQVMAT